MLQGGRNVAMDHTHYEYASEFPDFFACTKKDVREMIEKANEIAQRCLQDFRMFFSGDFDIKIEAKEEPFKCYSIIGTLTVNGQPVRTENPCTLLFIDLDQIVLKKMAKTFYAK